MTKDEIKNLREEIEFKFSQAEQLIFSGFNMSKYKNKHEAYFHGAKYFYLSVLNLLNNTKVEEENE